MHNEERDPERMRQRGKTVLVVDDSLFVRRAVRSALTSDGFDVCGEANDAIELAEKLSPDLIVLDLTMPVTNDLHASPVLRKVVPKSPIMLLTRKIVEQQLRTIEVDAVVSEVGPLSNLLGKAHILLGGDHFIRMLGRWRKREEELRPVSRCPCHWKRSSILHRIL
jgi:CheY-like chemotaxis protein